MITYVLLIHALNNNKLQNKIWIVIMNILNINK